MPHFADDDPTTYSPRLPQVPGQQGHGLALPPGLRLPGQASSPPQPRPSTRPTPYPRQQPPQAQPKSAPQRDDYRGRYGLQVILGVLAALGLLDDFTGIGAFDNVFVDALLAFAAFILYRETQNSARQTANTTWKLMATVVTLIVMADDGSLVGISDNPAGAVSAVSLGVLSYLDSRRAGAFRWHFLH